MHALARVLDKLGFVRESVRDHADRDGAVVYELTTAGREREPAVFGRR
jgi:hypothetical protein